MTATALQMPKQERAEPNAYGETKKYKQFMLTETASVMIDKMAESLNLTRSEALERAIRCGGLERAKSFNPETGECDTGK